MAMDSRSPSPSESLLHRERDRLSPDGYRSGTHHRDATQFRLERLDLSSQSSNSRDASPTDSDMSCDDNEHRVKLPSIQELCSGYLPPTGSGLEPGLRDLGIVQPVSSRSPAASQRNSCSCCETCADRRPRLPDSRIHACVPGFSPAVFEKGGPDSWKPAGPPIRVQGHRAPFTSAAPSACRTQPRFSQHPSYRHVYSLESDSEDGYYAHSPEPSSYTSSPRDGKPRPLYRAHSYEPEFGRSSPRPSSAHSRSSDYGPRTYHYGSPYSDNSSLPADSYGPSSNGATDSNWENYVEKAGRLNGAGPVMYTCRWMKVEGQPCNYTGKKQLAKRHVESVHLGKKPHVCPECRKPFPQKTSLDIHIRSVHTFQKPLKCEHCDAAFSDPARRHKHYRVEHPDKVVKKTRVKMEYKEIEHLLVK